MAANNNFDAEMKIPGGIFKGMSLWEAWKMNRNEFIRQASMEGYSGEGLKVVEAMRGYINAMVLQGEITATEVNQIRLGNIQKVATQQTVPTQAPPAQQMTAPAQEYTNDEAAPEYGDKNRYINQVCAVKHGAKDKSQAITLGVDTKLRYKKLDNNTVVPLSVIEDNSRFRLVLIEKNGLEKAVRMANLKPEEIKILETKYQACVQAEVDAALGSTIRRQGAAVTLLDTNYAYMADKQGRRHYHLTINFTLGQNSPFYVSIENFIETPNGDKIKLGKGKVNLSTAEFGKLLENMRQNLNNTISRGFDKALSNAVAGGHSMGEK